MRYASGVAVEEGCGREAVRLAEEGAGMASKTYDGFWRPLLSSITGRLRAVADGTGIQTIELPGLTDVRPQRQSWSGTVLLGSTRNSITSGTAAHVKSLARLLIDTAILENWPDKVFRLSVNNKGDTLTLKPVFGSARYPST